jgi:hypothetical protein
MLFHSTGPLFSSTSAIDSITGLVSKALAAPLKVVGPVVGLMSILAFFRYRGAIRKRLKQVKEESWIFGAGVTMERVEEPQESEDIFSNLRLLELTPEFVANEKGSMRMMSLGDYMSSLRPKQMPKKMSMDDLPQAVQRELEAGLASALLKALGPNLGRALLPAVGIGPIQKQAEKIATRIATDWFLSDEGFISESGDKAGFPVSLLSLLAFSEMNAKVNSGSSETDKKDGDAEKRAPTLPGLDLSAMDKFKLGEVVVGPSFVDEESGSLIPQDFVVENDFDRIIGSMEDRLRGESEDCHANESTELKVAKKEVLDEEVADKGDDKGSSCYDPEDRRMGEPVPINTRLFPDLYLGWGDAVCSHTKREVLKMRLLSTLLNKLGSNYDRRRKGDQNLFLVRMKASDSPISTPSAFLKALIDSCHQVKIFPTSRLTTFGLGMCIKEKDGSFTQVPLGVFIESGYEDAEGHMATAMMPHSGLDMFISGPLAGKRADGTPSELHIQHFIGIEGYCGWKHHSHPELPFNQAVPAGEPLTGEDAVRAARLAALYAYVLNGLATELHLPFGGYSTTAVCNDSAAILQQVLYGENTIYPLTSIGKYMQRTMRYAQRFQKDLSALDGMEEECRDIAALTMAMKMLPNDINASPSNLGSAAKRMLHTLQPKTPFVLMRESKAVMESILHEEEEMEINGVPTSGIATGVGTIKVS